MKQLLIICFILSFLTGCGDDTPGNTDDFDRTTLLINLSDNLILPALNGFKTNATVLNNDVAIFLNNPNPINLETLRATFETAYIAWQKASIFEIGPAENIAYRANVNTYPTDVSNITALINSGSYNLDAINNYDSKGLPAIDYLLYGSGDNDTDIIALFSTHPDKEKYKQYLSDIAEDILSKTNYVYNEWISGYDATFKSNKGNNIGSSISLFTNTFMLHYENRFRTLKIGLPTGVFSIEEQSFPELTEAYYSGISIDLIKANFNQLEKTYLGDNGVGIDDHLIGVDAEDVNSEITAQLAVIKEKLNLLTDPLSAQVVNDRPQVVEVYNEIQKLVPTLKADMFSALSIQITYSDTDGD
ncbi:MAG: imelysin family protein [Chitinophagales bacterium]